MIRRDFLKYVLASAALAVLPVPLVRAEQVSEEEKLFKYFLKTGKVRDCHEVTRQVFGFDFSQLKPIAFADGFAYIAFPKGLDVAWISRHGIEHGRFSHVDRWLALTLQFQDGNVRLREYDMKALGVYTPEWHDPGKTFARFPARDLNVDLESRIHRSYKGFPHYDISLKELAAYADESVLYDMPELARIHGQIPMTNCSAAIARPGEPSISRLAARLSSRRMSDEEKAQAHLDFVSKAIIYDEAEARLGREVGRRPTEGLLTGSADCNAKSVIYASLLGEAGIPYVLGYIFPMDGHLTVGVHGNFSNDNNMEFEFQGRTYHIAEPTRPGFKIGETRLSKNLAARLDYIQKPGERIFDRYGNVVEWYR